MAKINSETTDRGKGKPSVSSVAKKVRFDGLDVAAMTAHTRQTLLGYKLANVYDGGGTDKGTYVFKLTSPTSTTSAPKTDSNNANKDSSSGKVMLLMESGIRFHPTQYHQSDPTCNMPSNFAMKLRKHLRNLRLENVTQLGNLDRVVDFRFGSGNRGHHVILELYAKGNMVLTDCNYEILALLRTHDYSAASDKDAGQRDTSSAKNDEVVKVAVRQVYPVTYATTLSVDANKEFNSAEEKGTRVHAEESSIDMGSEIVEKKIDNTDAISKDEIQATVSHDSFRGLCDCDGKEAFQWAQEELRKHNDFQKQQKGDESKGQNKEGKKKKKKKKVSDGLTLRVLLLKQSSGVHHYGPSLLEHCILCANLDPNLKLSEEADDLDSILSSNGFGSLVLALKEEGSAMIDELMNGESQGYIFYKNKEHKEPESKEQDSSSIKNVPHSDKLFEEFQPHLLRQHGKRDYLCYPNFASAVDEFFSLIEGQKRALRAESAEQAAKDRLEKIRQDQEQRMKALEREQEKLKEHAQLVEIHADDVDKALTVINSALNTGMDWDDLDQLVEVEKGNKNPVALLIQRLDFKEDEMVLALRDEINGSDDSGCTPNVNVRISLHHSAHGNAREMFARYRQSKEKAQKTIEASSKALKAAEANAQKQLQEAQKKQIVAVKSARKQHWFEKFNWFITSDNYLVIAGRDAQQNEMIVKRYLRPGDAYLHADVHGAASCILRAKRRRTSKGTEVVPLSERALQEAGNFTICRSSAWASRMVTSAWWVESHQVSKTAPTGEYLTVGSFMIRGKKNFLPASQLEMGLAVLFRLGDDESVARHSNERRDFTFIDEDENDALDLDGGLKSPHVVFADDNKRDQEETEFESTAHVEESPDNEHSPKQSASISSLLDNEDNLFTLKEVDSTDSIDMHEHLASVSTNTKVKKTEVEENQQKVTQETTSQTVEVSESGLPSSTPEIKKRPKKGLSARDRRLIKRYGSLSATDKAIVNKQLEEEAKAVMSDTSLQSLNPLRQGISKADRRSPAPRGKKSKMKKAAKKYADQDEDDRNLAMLALHGGEQSSNKQDGKSNVPFAKSSTQLKAAADTTALLVKDSLAVAEKLPRDVYDILASCVSIKVSAKGSGLGDGIEPETQIRWDKFDADILEQLIDMNSHDAQLSAASRLLELTKSTRVDNFSASLAGIIRTIKRYGHEGISSITKSDESSKDANSKQRKTKSEKMAEKEAWKEILAEDGIIEEEEENELGAGDDSVELSKLTGKPVPEDVLLYAIPVCAPYQSLTHYKYRVKLTPGSQKRGKASKQCLEIFLKNDNDQSDAGNRNRSFIKLITDNEWTQAICGDVKISSPGASKIAKNQKGKKKGGKKRS